MLRRLVWIPFCSLIASAAGITTLDFNNLQVGEEALNYYTGGFGNLGTGPGPSYGVTFTPDFMTVAQGVFVPPARAEMLTGTSGTMNVLNGFNGLFSFYYEATTAGSAAFYSGLNGTGTLVGSIVLPSESTFSPAGNLEPLFESVVFSSTANSLIVDNITFGAQVVPEPSSGVLFAVALSGLLLLGVSRAKSLQRFQRAARTLAKHGFEEIA